MIVNGRFVKKNVDNLIHQQLWGKSYVLAFLFKKKIKFQFLNIYWFHPHTARALLAILDFQTFPTLLKK